MNGPSGFREMWSSSSRSSSYRLPDKQQPQFGTGAWQFLGTHDFIALSTGISEKREKVPVTILSPHTRRNDPMKISYLAVTGMLVSLSACSANLVVQGVKDPTVFNGIRVYGPANFIVTKETVTENCPKKTTQTVIQLPGDPYDVTVKPAWFAKSEFTVMFTDTGLLKQVTLNSTPQLAENLTAMAELAKTVGEATKPVKTLAANECGDAIETITDMKRIK